VNKKDKTLDLNEIIKKYKPLVSFKVRKSIGNNYPEWEDVVNEIMSNIVEQIQKGKFRGDSSIGTFIFTITHRRIIDHIREKKKAFKFIPDPKYFPDPLEITEQEEKKEHLLNAINQLKPKYRKVLYLYYFKEYSSKEIAHVLGIPGKRVSELVNYARKLLKKKLKKDFFHFL
jgi:RNA polymerase sigma-70 factor (ECF subfamily)